MRTRTSCKVANVLRSDVQTYPDPRYLHNPTPANKFLNIVNAYIKNFRGFSAVSVPVENNMMHQPYKNDQVH